MTTQKHPIIKVPELNVSFSKDSLVDFPTKISSSQTAAKLIRSLYEKDEIELHEVMFVIYRNRANQPIGYYKHSVGGVSRTVVDSKIILGAALKSLSSAVILAHNHPSGETKPSQADKDLTKRIQSAAALFDISVLDHLIITKTDYNSLADNGFMGVDSPYPIELMPPTVIEENKDSIKRYELEAKAIEVELELLKL